jgi:cytochrome P450
VTNGAEWKRQRRIIDPAFEGGRLRDTFPAMLGGGEAAVARMAAGEVEVELSGQPCGGGCDLPHAVFDPDRGRVAQAVFHEFRAYQRTQPILNLAAFLPLPRWMPRLHRRATRDGGRHPRADRRADGRRAAAIAAGTAPDDLATKIMTTPTR